MAATCFAEYLYAYHRLEWRRYVEGESVDLLAVSRELHACAEEEDPEHPVQKRARIEHHPEVAALREKLDTNAGLPQGPPSTRARAMAPHVKRLMQLRTMRAQTLGYRDYKDFDCEQNRIHEETIQSALDTVLKQHLPKARELIDRHGFSWATWFEDLRTFRPFEKLLDPEAIIQRLIEGLGLEALDSRLVVHIDPQGMAGFARLFENGRVHIATRPLDTPFALRTFLHELSHGLLYLYHEPPGHEKFLTPASDEFLAVVLENLLIDNVCTQTEQDSLKSVEHLEASRVALSAKFELDLWNNVDTPQQRYQHHYGRLLEVEAPECWTLDSFRSVDALLIQYYAIGYAASANLLTIVESEQLEGAALGEWLKRHLLARAGEIEIAAFL